MISSVAATGKTIGRRIAFLTGGFIFLFLFSVAFAIATAIAAAANNPGTLGLFLGFLFATVASSLFGAAAIELIIDELTKS